MNYFKEAERVLMSRRNLERSLENLNRRLQHTIRNGAPHEIGGIDYSKPYAKESAVNDTMKDCLDVIEIKKEIADTETEIKMIDDVISQLSEKSKQVLTFWYVEGKTKDEIREALGKDGSTTIYSTRNKAIGEFAVLYFGAGALAST